MEEPTQERRNVERHRVFKGAHISFKGHSAIIKCTVRNFSDGSACLKVESPIGIPDSFELMLDDAAWNGGKPRKSALAQPDFPANVNCR
jgi:hypothetical protein